MTEVRVHRCIRAWANVTSTSALLIAEKSRTQIYRAYPDKKEVGHANDFLFV
jgi:hypothetical protein